MSIRDLVETSLGNIHKADGEGSRAFTRVYEEAARTRAEFLDGTQAQSDENLPLAGIPISIKDLFDIAGEPTLAGSRVLKDALPATEDAEIVQRLRKAGGIIIGKTNMTEFAFSGLGLNPHYGTPASPWQRDKRRIPGGSSSGAGISVADNMAIAAIGTDTGGSIRIPAAICGLVGFKPTAATVPQRGMLPLSHSFDSIGPIARDVGTCASIYSVLSGQRQHPLAPLALSSIRLGVVKNVVLEKLDAQVTKTYAAALSACRRPAFACRIWPVLPVLDRQSVYSVHGGIVVAEAYAWHEKLFAERSHLYDPRVASRVAHGRHVSAADYRALQDERTGLIKQWEIEIASVDAVIMPTIPIVPPTIEEAGDEKNYNRLDRLILRNPTIGNLMNGCSITLPCHEASDAPVGLMLIAREGHDHELLRIAKMLEQVLPQRQSAPAHS
jgi:aspartyl-tRNA(Asn)/glutamyl-tRNA(Gln) amidotransferase subunit A